MRRIGESDDQFLDPNCLIDGETLADGFYGADETR
jgi:hypothetical protein